MEEPQMPQKRVRIEVSTSTKGVHTYSVTLEYTGESPAINPDAILQEHDSLVAKLDGRYPAVEA